MRHSTIGICLGDINSIFWRLFNGYKDTFCLALWAFGFACYFRVSVTCFTVLRGFSSVSCVFFGC